MLLLLCSKFTSQSMNSTKLQEVITLLDSGDRMAKIQALDLLVKQGIDSLLNKEVLRIVTELDYLTDKYVLNDSWEWTIFFDKLGEVYANAHVVRHQNYRATGGICLTGHPNASVLYALSDDHPSKYQLVCGLALSGDRRLAYYQDSKKYLMQILHLDAFEGYATVVKVDREVKQFTEFAGGYRADWELTLVNEFFGSLLPCIVEPQNRKLIEVRVFDNDSVKTYQMIELFGVTWYLTVLGRLHCMYLSSYIPDRKETKRFVTSYSR